jgi:hypothetical protein
MAERQDTLAILTKDLHRNPVVVLLIRQWYYMLMIYSRQQEHLTTFSSNCRNLGQGFIDLQHTIIQLYAVGLYASKHKMQLEACSIQLYNCMLQAIIA